MNSWGRKILWGRVRLPTPVFLGFPCGSAGRESACYVGDLGLIPGLGRSLEKRKATYSIVLAWRIPWTDYRVYGVTKSQTQLATFAFTFHILVNVIGLPKSTLYYFHMSFLIDNNICFSSGQSLVNSTSNKSENLIVNG